ncbi:hydroxymethylglutaryl-CoA synthase, partial [Candidatus Gottesmanbacteria bacterium]|nr:hydroxymethylglutaryl-CoA synthase [Candidatus Gottesmanbacteria bacterium]
MDVEILGYGIYIPQYRIKVAEIASIWGKDVTAIERSLGVKEKSVAAQDEDTVTMSFEAAFLALQRACLPPSAVDICFVGSESHPYAVNPTSTIVAEFLGVGRNYLSVDLEFACKAA